MQLDSNLVTTVRFFQCAQMPSLEEFCSFCGFDDVLQGCSSVTQEMQSRGYDPLDIENAAFDRDYLEYSVNISDLKNSLQVKHCYLGPNFKWLPNYIIVVVALVLAWDCRHTWMIRSSLWLVQKALRKQLGLFKPLPLLYHNLLLLIV